MASEVCWQNDDGEISSSQILLGIDVLVARDQSVEAVILGKAQQLSVFLLLPGIGIRRGREPSGFERDCKMSRHTLVQEDPPRHEPSSGSVRSFDLLYCCTRELNCCDRAVARKTWIGVEDRVERHPVRQILEQNIDRNASSVKNEPTAHHLGIRGEQGYARHRLLALDIHCRNPVSLSHYISD